MFDDRRDYSHAPPVTLQTEPQSLVNLRVLKTNWSWLTGHFDPDNVGLQNHHGHFRRCRVQVCRGTRFCRGYLINDVGGRGPIFDSLLQRVLQIKDTHSKVRWWSRKVLKIDHCSSSQPYSRGINFSTARHLTHAFLPQSCVFLVVFHLINTLQKKNTPRHSQQCRRPASSAGETPPPKKKKKQRAHHARNSN